MSTRGAYGFRINGHDKVSYNHGDSYPTGLGVDIANFVADTPLAELRETAARVELVDEQSKPTREQVASCRGWLDTGVGSGSEDDWYCLLRGAQGDLFALKNGLSYMIDSSGFLLDALFCEWAYIVDVDQEVLEVYVGFNKTIGTGRYDSKMGANGYTGVSLLLRMPLDRLGMLDEEQIDRLMEAVENLRQTQYEDFDETEYGFDKHTPAQEIDEILGENHPGAKTNDVLRAAEKAGITVEDNGISTKGDPVEALQRFANLLKLKD